LKPERGSDLLASVLWLVTTFGKASFRLVTLEPYEAWRRWSVMPEATNVACLDYSVAKGGMLCAYRWDGEQELLNDKFCSVQSKQA
jgi:hypothetical protein